MAEQYIGEIRMFAGTYAPEGWAFCDGQLLPISNNEVLFSLIGTTFGGDGQSSFALPDLRGRIPIGVGNGNPHGGMGGVEQITLTMGQLPAHTHLARSFAHIGNQEVPTNAVWAQSEDKQYSTATPNTLMDVNLISPVGGNRPHNNMMPTTSVHFIIALVGAYPSFD